MSEKKISDENGIKKDKYLQINKSQKLLRHNRLIIANVRFCTITSPDDQQKRGTLYPYHAFLTKCKLKERE